MLIQPLPPPPIADVFLTFSDIGGVAVNWSLRLFLKAPRVILIFIKCSYILKPQGWGHLYCKKKADLDTDHFHREGE